MADYPEGFTYAFRRLEQAIEELVVGKGAIKSRLEPVVSTTLGAISPEDFPEPIGEEYASISEELNRITPEEGSNQGSVAATLEVMTLDEAGSLAGRLFALYRSAAADLGEGPSFKRA